MNKKVLYGASTHDCCACFSSPKVHPLSCIRCLLLSPSELGQKWYPSFTIPPSLHLQPQPHSYVSIRILVMVSIELKLSHLGEMGLYHSLMITMLARVVQEDWWSDQSQEWDLVNISKQRTRIQTGCNGNRQAAREGRRRSAALLLPTTRVSTRNCDVWIGCVIMHNMIMESERDDHRIFDHARDIMGPLANPNPWVPSKFADFISMHNEIRDENVNHQLQDDLADHLWALKGQQ